MRIGIDIHFCRKTQTGIYTYLWNVIHWLHRLEHPPHITLFLFGQSRIDEPEQIGRMKAAFAEVDFQYYWDDVPLNLLSDRFGNEATTASRLAGELDRRLLLRIWRKMVVSDSPYIQQFARLARRNHQEPLSEEVDLLHHPAGLLLPLHDRTNVMTINDLIPYHFPYYYPYELKWFKESFDRTDQMDIIMTYSEHTKRDVVETLGVDGEKIHVIPLAAHEQYRPLPKDKEEVQSVLARYNLTSVPYIIHLGALEPRKNISRLVEAFHLLLQEEPSLEHRLILVGPRFGLYEPIFETIRHLHLESRVEWLGEVPFEDLPALLNGADLFVYPSLYEGFGLPPLEAMSCGTPVMVSRATSLPEVVGDAGLLIDPYQIKEIAEAMQQVLTSRELRTMLSEKGLRRAQMFSWEKTARLTLTAYEEALTRSRNKGHKGPSHQSDESMKTKNYQNARHWFVDQAVNQTLNKLRP